MSRNRVVGRLSVKVGEWWISHLLDGQITAKREGK